MKKSTKTAVGFLLLIWSPFAVLRIYWLVLVAKVPEASHGEVSGPVLYFLPRLLLIAAVLSVAIVGWFAVSAIASRRKDK
jgi:hypothetical protein